MDIKQSLISKSKYSVKCPYTMTAEFIVVHNTANDAPAANEIAYMIRNNNQISYHIAVDDIEAIQAIPFNRNAWHAGDGANGKGNRKGIAVEICYSKSGGSKFDKAEQNGAKVAARLLKERKWGISKVKKHQDFSRKYCPHRTLDRGWNRFLKMIERELGNTSINTKPVVSKPKSKPNTSSSTSKIAVDGYWGAITTRALQKALGTFQDGIISGQYSNAVTKVITGVRINNGNGSPMVKALQRKVGAKIDGYLGPETIRALQRYLKTPIDGDISRPSIMIRELQRRLNNNTF